LVLNNVLSKTEAENCTLSELQGWFDATTKFYEKQKPKPVDDPRIIDPNKLKGKGA